MKTAIFAAIIITLLIFLLNGFPQNPFQKDQPDAPDAVDPRALEIMQKEEPLTDEELKYLLQGTFIPFLKTGSEDRKLLQLALFYLKVREDPLFTSPDFDLEEFAKSVHYLEQEQALLLNPQKRNVPIFPVSFLKTLPEVTEVQRLFLSDPNPETAGKLLETYQKTADAYQQDIKNFTGNLETNKDLLDPYDTIQLRVVTNRDIFFADLQKIAQNAQSIQEEIQNRKNCLDKGQNCSRQMFFFLRPEVKPIQEAKFDLLPFDLLFPVNPPAADQVRGPYIIHTPCWGWDKDFTFPAQPILVRDSKSLYIKNSEGQNPPTQILKLATDKFFRQTTASDLFDEGLKKLGFLWIGQSETTGYLCRNLEYQPKVTTLDAFLQKYRDQTILDKINRKEIQNFQKFEGDFFASKTPADVDLQTLADIYAYAYRLLASGESEYGTTNELLNRFLIINRQVSNFHLNLNRYANEFTILIRIQDKDPDLFSQDNIFYGYVFPFKSYWNVLYFPFSPSFWRSDQRLEYLKKVNPEERPLERKWAISYQEALKLASPEELKIWSRAGIEYAQKNFPAIQIE